MDRLEAALNRASQGFSVYPIRPGGKLEYTSREGAPGYRPGWTRTDATTDPEKIRAWWELEPAGGVGYLIPPGWVAVDYDPRNGAQVPDPLPATLGEAKPGGAHLIYRLPPCLELRGKVAPELLPAGIEVLGEGASLKIHGAYTPICAPQALQAPQWALEAIRAHNAAQEARRTRLDAIQVPTTGETDPARLGRWAEAALLRLTQEIAEAPEGSRSDTLNRLAFKAGQLAHALGGASKVADVLERTCASWPNQAKVKATIERAIRAGVAKPRYPATTQALQATETRQGLEAMRKQLALTPLPGRMETGQGGGVRGVTVQAVLDVALEQGHKANRLDGLGLSVRSCAERADIGGKAAHKALHAAVNAGLLELQERGGAELERGETRANVYALRPGGFIRMQSSPRQIGRKDHTNSLPGKNARKAKNFSSGRPANVVFSPHLGRPANVPPLLTPEELETARLAGIFGARALGKGAYKVTRALAARGPLKPGELATVTGLHLRTVRKALQRLAEAGLIERPRGLPVQLVPLEAFREAVARGVEAYQTGERLANRARLHALERQAFKSLRERERPDRIHTPAMPPELLEARTALEPLKARAMARAAQAQERAEREAREAQEAPRSSFISQAIWLLLAANGPMLPREVIRALELSPGELMPAVRALGGLATRGPDKRLALLGG